MENYYEILEISKNASPEIIEKAYKVLAKKYHPDMHEEEKKEWAEAEFKKISEAYEILSDEEKRKEYDIKLEKDIQDNSEQDEEKYKELLQEIEILKQRLAYYENEDRQNKNVGADAYVSQETGTEQEPEQNQGYYTNNNYQYNNNQYNNYRDNNFNNYNNQYNSYNNPYTEQYSYIKKENIFIRIGKNILSIVLTIIVITIIGLILWSIPATRTWLQGIYEETPGIKLIIDLFKKQ